jgi:hypothetical protein
MGESDGPYPCEHKDPSGAKCGAEAWLILLSAEETVRLACEEEAQMRGPIEKMRSPVGIALRNKMGRILCKQHLKEAVPPGTPLAATCLGGMVAAHNLQKV